jgi:hypothetical protein
MPPAGFEPMIPVFKQAKPFHALDHAATETGIFTLKEPKIRQPLFSKKQYMNKKTGFIFRLIW